MTIKEIESRSGMVRANIRFYEAEGLLHPQREANGYRNYSQDDLETLLRIKLLRTLGLSIEEIRALGRGEAALPDALDERLAQLEREQAAAERSRQVCRTMRADGVQWENLDARPYLDAYAAGPYAPAPTRAVREDVTPRVRSPWRRFFARGLDLTLCQLLCSALFCLMGNSGLTQDTWGTATALLALPLLLLLEPLFLSLLGATPGKLILGLEVTDGEDGRLSYPAALRRTWGALLYGCGLTVPLVDLYRLWKSFRSCGEGETLPWEENSELTLRDEKPWRSVAAGLAWAAQVGLFVLTISAAGMPPHRGTVTVAEFCDNYNRLSAYYGVDITYQGEGGANYQGLDSDGSWSALAGDGTVYIYMSELCAPPELQFSESEGAMTGLCLSAALEGGDEMLFEPYGNEMQLAVLSFVAAQNGGPVRGEQVQSLLEQIEGYDFQSFEAQANGVTVTCQVDYSGYALWHTGDAAVLSPREGEETHFSFRFSMTQTE